MKDAAHAFVTHLWRQVALMDELSRLEKALQEAVQDREWEHLQTIMRSMTDTSEEMSCAESDRLAAYRVLAGPEGASMEFSAVIARLPADIRADISDAYRALKASVLRIKSRTSGIDTYLRSTISTMRGVMRELYPEHATTVYSSRGHGSFTGGQALVVNHHL